MPIMDGYEATKAIREFLYDNDLCQPIISACTGHSTDAYIAKCFDSGMNQALSKPTKIDILKDLLIKTKYIQE